MITENYMNNRRIKPKISIIIPNYNNEEKLEKNINFILNQNVQNFEIIIVDNGSENIDLIINKFKKNKRIKVIKLNKNFGFTYASNLGVEKARSEIIVLLNNDAYLRDKFFLKKTIKIFEKYRSENKIAGIFPLVIFEKNKKFINSFYSFWHEKWMWYDPFVGLPVETIKKIKEDKVVFGSIFVCLIIKKNTFLEIGKFDEKLFTYGEDFDFCLRANIFGYKFIATPSLIVFHDYRSSSNEEKNPYWSLYFYLRNYLLVVLKNYELINLIKYFKFIIRPHLTYLKIFINKKDFNILLVILKSLLSVFLNTIHIFKERLKINKKRLKKDKDIFNYDLLPPYNPYFYDNKIVINLEVIKKIL